ncbi:hypothetical protein [Aurantiacibacter gangjinensis]|uniref:Uncharacterized protein n=1 Tax=Aurantiacibacter gangjinensis TaxID=502682 RepID=A0A0G9MKX5_9SPHN|nr:hypothetical protein [Aurantiacibacter gangjinensis]APE27216.1 hypothetical protein BMF35_a0387 [Aurantiacibacter gangjinensis]KLE31340.1 hypothetical protein AAW01_06945 [Aurantiacibacter gangjinensis]
MGLAIDLNTLFETSDLWFLAAGASVGLVLGIWPHLRFRFERWKVERALAADGGAFARDRAALAMAEEEQPPPFRWPRLFFGLVLGAMSLAIPRLADSFENGFWLIPLAFLAIWAIDYGFGKLEERFWPDHVQKRDDDDSGLPEMDVPFDAKAGFAADMTVLGFIAIVAWAF